jgi:hypothetical protein
LTFRTDGGNVCQSVISEVGRLWDINLQFKPPPGVALAVALLLLLSLASVHGCTSASKSNSPQVPVGAPAESAKLGLAQGFSQGETNAVNGLLDDPTPDPFEEIDWPIVPFTDPRTGETYNIAEGRVLVKLTNTPQLPQMDPNYFDVEHNVNEPYYGIAYHPLTNDPAVAAFVAAEQLEVFTGWPEIGSIGVILPEGTTMLDAVQNWPTEYPDVVQAADPDAVCEFSAFPQGDPNDGAFQHQDNLPGHGPFKGQWNLDDPDPGELASSNPYHINIQEAWRHGYVGSSSVVVAVIDTGVEWHLPDMQVYSTWYGCNTYDKLNSTRFATRPNLNGGEPSDFTKNYNSTTAQECGHGTGVASLLAAGLNNDHPHSPGYWDGYDLAGIAPSCKYFPIAVKCKYNLDHDGSYVGGTFTSAVINAFAVVGSVKGIYDCNRTLLGMGAPHYNIEVVNCNAISYEWNSTLYQEVINVSPYVNIVCPAGNGGYLDHIPYPGAYSWLPGIISVGGYQQDGRIFGNDPPDITIFAPGSDFPVLDLIGVNQRNEQLGFVSDAAGNVYLSASGTCYATPAVSGVAALLVSRYPALTPQQVKTRIRQYASPLPPDPDHSNLSFWRVDAYRALSGT